MKSLGEFVSGVLVLPPVPGMIARGFAIVVVLSIATLGMGVAHAAARESVLHRFTDGKDGGFPEAGLTMDLSGALYGTTYSGGACGTVFKFTPPASGKTAWAESVLYTFTGCQGGGDGYDPRGGVIMDKSGALFGTTWRGGTGPHGPWGTVFELIPPAPGKKTWTETVLYSFAAGSDGAEPESGVIMDKSGALYGTTSGGPNCCGTVFKLTPPAQGKTAWTETVLHTFTGFKDGGTPAAGLIMDETGNLYGTTSYSGENGYGLVFKLTPPPPGKALWTETVLHSFTGGKDGAYPMASVVIDKSGAVYGTARNAGDPAGCPVNAGPGGCGVVFKLTPPAPGKTAWTDTTLRIFTGGKDGAYPVAGLILDMSGVVYGTTSWGGNATACPGNSSQAVPTGCGVVFKLTPPAPGSKAWAETVLRSFAGGNDGSIPEAGVIMDQSAMLHGTTTKGGNPSACPATTVGLAGCGVAFGLSP